MGDKRVRKVKLFRRKMWAVVSPAFNPLLYRTKKQAKWRSCCFEDRVIPVMVTEIRKAGAKRGRKT